jgi:hypothetical protein
MVSTPESCMKLGVVWILFRITSSLPREVVVASLFPCSSPIMVSYLLIYSKGSSLEFCLLQKRQYGFHYGSIYSTCRMPQLRHKNASIEAHKNVLRASQPGTLFTRAYKELTMGIPSILTAIERNMLNQSNFKQ